MLIFFYFLYNLLHEILCTEEKNIFLPFCHWKKRKSFILNEMFRLKYIIKAAVICQILNGQEHFCNTQLNLIICVTVLSLLEMHSGGNIGRPQCRPFSPGILGASDLILIYYWGGLRSAAPMGGGPCSAVLQHLRAANALVRV